MQQYITDTMVQNASDVSLTSPVANDILAWNGTEFVNIHASQASGYVALNGNYGVAIGGASASGNFASASGSYASASGSYASASGNYGHATGLYSNVGYVPSVMTFAATTVTISGNVLKQFLVGDSVLCGGGSYNSTRTVSAASYSSPNTTLTLSTAPPTGSNSIVSNTRGSFGSARGNYVRARLVGEHAVGTGDFANVGDAQSSAMTLRGITTAATATTLALDGASALPQLSADQSAWRFTADIVAYDTTSNIAGGFKVEGCVKLNSTGAYSLVGTPTVTSWLDTGFTGSVAVGTTGGLQINCTGIASATIRWVAKLSVVQVSFGAP